MKIESRASSYFSSPLYPAVPLKGKRFQAWKRMLMMTSPVPRRAKGTTIDTLKGEETDEVDYADDYLFSGRDISEKVQSNSGSCLDSGTVLIRDLCE